MLNYLGLWWVKAVVVGGLALLAGWAGYEAGYDRCFRKLSQEAAHLRLELAGIEQRRLRDTADLSEANRKTEQAHARRMAQADKQLMEALRDGNTKRDAALVGLRLDAGRLFIPTATACSRSGDAAGAPSGADGTHRAELSDEAAEFLIGLAAEADACAVRLTAAQELIGAVYHQQDRQ
ncbi:MAG TPA: lysis system i-spanin subunit Rz [Rhodocyclaceae bacterium]|nr:lysis system i-spanin subunit Rz [Rhodocyclaceae bacterium]